MGGCCSKSSGPMTGVVPGNTGQDMYPLSPATTTVVEPQYSFDGSTLRVVGVHALPLSVVEKYSQTTGAVELSSCGLDSLASLSHLQAFPRLEALSLQGNGLTSLGSIPPLPRVASLSLVKNSLADVHELVTVLAAKMPGLLSLDTRQNPCCPHPRYQVDKTDADYNIYRNYVLTRLTSLESLDDVVVSDAERDAAKAVSKLMGGASPHGGYGLAQRSSMSGGGSGRLGVGDLDPLNVSNGTLLHASAGAEDTLEMRDPETGALLTHEQALIRKRRSLHKIRKEVTAAAAGSRGAGSGSADPSSSADTDRVVRSLSMTTSSDFVETMLSSMDIVHYQRGDLIVRRGDVGSAMFFIIAGRVEIVLPESPEGKQRPNPTCSAGDFFGEIAMFLERKRTASVRALMDVDVCVLTKDVCEAVLFQYPLIHHEFLMLAQNRLQADLDGKASGAHVTPEWMRSVAHAVESMGSANSPTGSALGSAAPAPAQGHDHSVSGDELAASSTASTSLHEQRRKLRMGALNRQFDEWDVEQNKNTAHRRKMRAHKRKWFSINVTRGIDQYDIPKFLKEVLGSMITQHYDAGDYIVRRGERGSSMFFIARGVVDIEFDDPKRKAASSAEPAAKRENVTLGAGDFFGEIAMFIEGKRTASVVARTEVDLSVLTKKVMDSVLAKYPMIKEEFVLLGQERLRKDQQWASIVGGEPKKPQNWMEKISRRAGTLFLKARSGTADGSDALPEGSLGSPGSSPQSELAAALRANREDVISLMRQCYVLFDFDDPGADAQGKAHKQRALLTLAEVYGSAGSEIPIDDMEYPVLLSLLRANLFFERARPDGINTDLHAADYDFTDEPQPVLLKSWPHVEVVYHIFKSFLKHPSFSVSLAKEYITRDFAAELLGLLASHDPDERANVKDVLVVLYGTCTYLQRFLRDSIAHVILTFVYENELHPGPRDIIHLIHESGMVAHFGSPLGPDGKAFIERVLLSLFKSVQLVRFIEPLIALLREYVLPIPGMPASVLQFLGRFWPKTFAAKEELFLRQLADVLDFVGPDGATALPAPAQDVALHRVAACIESPQLQVAERALTLLGSAACEALVAADLEKALPILIGPLYRNSRSHWDSFVCSFTYDRLQAIMELDKMAFAAALQNYAKLEKARKKEAKARAQKWAVIEEAARLHHSPHP